MNTKLMLSGTLLLAFSATAQTKKAAAPKPQQTAPIKEAFSHQGKGYGTAGCGLGGMVFGNKPGMIQIVAVTVNNIVAPQTFAISSGTSGCGAGGKKSAALYIESNRVALAREAARGDGETVAGLSKIMGCQDSQVFGKAIQRAYPTIFGNVNASSDQVNDAIDNTIRSDRSLAKSCS